MRATNHLDRLSDIELASLSAAGDRAAFGVLMARHSGLVRGLVRRMGAQATLADDIAQDAFIAAFTGIGGYRGEGSFGGWVCRIASRLYIMKSGHVVDSGDTEAILSNPQHEYTRLLLSSVPGSESVSRGGGVA